MYIVVDMNNVHVRTCTNMHLTCLDFFTLDNLNFSYRKLKYYKLIINTHTCIW